MAAAEDRHGRLAEQPAHPRIASLGDPPAALALPRAQLSGNEAERRLHLICARRKRCASSIVATKAAAVTGPILGTVRSRCTRAWGRVTASIATVRVRELLIDGPHHREQRRNLREQAARQR